MEFATLSWPSFFSVPSSCSWPHVCVPMCEEAVYLSSLEMWVMWWLSGPSVFLPGYDFTLLCGWIQFALCVWSTFFFIHLSADRQLAWFCFSALVDRKAIRLSVQKSLWYVDLASFRHIDSGVIEPSHMTVLLSRLRTHRTDFIWQSWFYAHSSVRCIAVSMGIRPMDLESTCYTDLMILHTNTSLLWVTLMQKYVPRHSPSQWEGSAGWMQAPRRRSSPPLFLFFTIVTSKCLQWKLLT